MHATRATQPVALLVAVSLLTQGCAAWREVHRTTPTRYLAEHHPKRIRVTLPDSSLVLRSPAAAADSIRGIEEKGDTLGGQLTLPESQIRALAIRGPSPWPMRVAAGASAALVIAIAIGLLSTPHRAVK
jgi:hypothetical protein